MTKHRDTSTRPLSEEEVTPLSVKAEYHDLPLHVDGNLIQLGSQTIDTSYYPEQEEVLCAWMDSAHCRKGKG